MKRKLIFVNFLLLCLTVFAGSKLREQYLADQARSEKLRTQRVKEEAPARAVPTPKPDPFTGLPYQDVAQKNLFSKDRNPNVVIEVPPPKPEKKMPPLPVMVGVMGLPSGMMALMSERADAKPHGVRVGERVGEFKVVALTPEAVSFEWDGKKIDKKVEDLLARAPAPDPVAASANPANIQPGAPPAPAKPSAVAMGNNVKGCTPGDTSPAGTVVDGYKKILEATPFGNACRWIPAN
ncbi:MAG: hypothetical protein M3Z09_16390 [Acidobacteriota bacterium]|nr:hypothetical protein [Acidobacteriota bacterium]